MAFTSSYFGRVMVNKSEQIPSAFAYNGKDAGDDLETIITTGYFNDYISTMQVNDLIFITATDAVAMYYITSVTTNVAVAAYNYNSKISSSAPTSTDDISSGYVIGQIWVNTDTDIVYVCADNTEDAAVWVSFNEKTISSASAPGVNDDEDDGYEIGQLWVVTVAPFETYILVDPTAGAAVWNKQAKAAHVEAGDPGVNDDIDAGYQNGQLWINSGDAGLFICIDNASGAADWDEATTT